MQTPLVVRTGPSSPRMGFGDIDLQRRASDTLDGWHLDASSKTRRRLVIPRMLGQLCRDALVAPNHLLYDLTVRSYLHSLLPFVSRAQPIP